ncbi:MAG: OPT/YSL family transporter [Phycisphaeraceae bacterium]|nr:OPT/YSL family transporter [Phycisphaeraceae bacterium]MCB9847321.1 OPT/YSL family transporter [Phycisphaeraceae bacterium]
MARSTTGDHAGSETRSMDNTPEPAPQTTPAPKGAPRARGKYREVTIASIVFGVVVGAIMNAAITYAGLKIGFTIVGSSIAAVLGFGVLRGVLRKGSILEVNIAQTVGSAVNTPNSGVIFTVPVLFLLGIPLVAGTSPNINFILLCIACVAGAILGCAFIVPLRKQMLDIERLRFPSAVAVGTILKSPGAGPKKALMLVIGIVIASIIAAPAQLPQVEGEARLDELEHLRFEEKITDQDILLTNLINGWMTNQNAPTALVEHGRVRGELKDARKHVDELSSSGADCQAISDAKHTADEIQDRVNEAKAASLAAINATLPKGAVGEYPLNDYPDVLPDRVFAVTTGVEGASWDDLRSRKAGWAAKPMWGYSDLGIRIGEQIDTQAGTLDFGYNGYGTQDPVLTVKSDRDRGGRPDLVVDDENVDAGRILGLPDHMQLLFAIAPFALGAGYLTGRAGLFVLAGGVIAYLFINPLMFMMGWMPETITAHEAANFGYRNINRPLGIGLLLGGAMMGVVASLPAIKEAFKSIAASGGGSSSKVGKDELGLRVLLVAVLLGGAFLFFASNYTATEAINHTDPITHNEVCPSVDTTEYWGYAVGFETQDSLEQWKSGAFTDSQKAEFMATLSAKPGILAKLGLPSFARSAIIALIGIAWIWFAGIIIAQCTGMTDWSPISGMALITVVLVMVLGGTGDVLAAVMLGSALCVAITCAADMMADLKTGYLVGGSPRRQQIVEIISTGAGPVITMFVLLLIAASNMEKFGIPMGDGTDTTAPQAQALQAIITGVQGGEMPYALYGFGALLGGLLGLGAFSGLGVLVGLSMYLPMNYIATYGIGCVINIIVARWKGRTFAEEWGVPLAAGFIVGDALLSLGVNMFVLVGS